MNWFIDRIENKVAVIEILGKGGRFEIPVESLPENAKEGMVLKVEVDEQETKSREERIKMLMEKLKNQ